MAPDRKTRTEHDTMGEMQVPVDALWGASTARAVANFPVSGWPMPPRIIHALGRIKMHAAEVNAELGLLDEGLAAAIAKAAAEVAEGTLDAHFPVDVFQTGSGTSTNMNMNEVIAARATAILGYGPGEDRVHPNDHVNLGQSSNDVIPTAIHLAAASALKSALLPTLSGLEVAIRARTKTFGDVLKTGRTHLQDATPVRMGQVFAGYAAQVVQARERLEAAADALGEVALGGTAVGTGINTHPAFAGKVCAALAEATGLNVREARDHFAAQGAMDGIVAASAAVRGAALALAKIAGDIAWLGSGPRAGLGELALPAVQPGSSIMPGKVNPVIAESLLMVCAHVVGGDAAVAWCVPWTRFELAAMFPVAGYHLVTSIELLAAATANFSERCVQGLKATERGPELVARGLALATALVPVIGYDDAAAIAKEAAASGQTVREVAEEKTEIPPEQLDRILDPARMTMPGLPEKPPAAAPPEGA
jgi:fumarate hydratase, class II